MRVSLSLGRRGRSLATSRVRWRLRRRVEPRSQPAGAARARPCSSDLRLFSGRLEFASASAEGSERRRVRAEEPV